MKGLIKFFKYGLYTVIVLIVLGLAFVFVGHKYLFPIEYGETTTINDIRKDGFCFDVNCQPGASTVDEFLPQFASQVKNYNNVAPYI